MGRWWCGKKKTREGTSNPFFKNVRPFPPGRQDAAPRRCGVVAPFASGPPPPLPPAPQRPCHSFGIRALLARLRLRTPRPRENGDSHCSSAAGAAHRAPTSSSCSAPQKPHSPVPPDPCATPRSHGPFLPHRPRAPPHPPAASCAMHSTPLVQDLQGHAPHLRRRVHPFRTHALLPRGIDVRAAHGQVLEAQGLRRGG